ncbi:MAG: zinc-binding dehydrogenase [Archangium sp.]|nr:zinc-binding dehydrogenase [Archangium sp.]
MRAVRFHEFGGPEVLRLEAVAVPECTPGHVLVDVHAVGINFADTERRRGLYRKDEPLPVTTGLEGSGVVREVGPGVDASWVGRRVAFLASESAAEVCRVEVERLIPLPSSLSFIEGAAFPLQGLTAWHVLHTVARVEPGDTVAITAAAGGVGLLAVQVAALAECHVIGLVSSRAKADVVLRRGAHEVVVGDEAEHLRDSVDVLVDSVGREVSALGLRALRPFGRWVCFGDSSGGAAAIDPAKLLERSLQVCGYWLRTPHPVHVWKKGLDEVLSLLGSKQLELDVTTVPLQSLAETHRALESRRSTGKFVVTLR